MRKIVLIFGVVLAFGNFSLGQDTQSRPPSDEELLSVARMVMEKAGNCALISLDETGHPRARTMDPFPPDAGMIVWFGTNSQSRKVKQIRTDPRVTLYYFDKEGSSYVIITGKAQLVDDPELKESKWKQEWSDFYPDREKDYMLIKVVPETLEVLSTQHGIFGDPETWEPPIVRF